MTEIERKFLPRITIPEIPLIQSKNPHTTIKQGYLLNTPTMTERFRSIQDDNGITYVRTIKTGSGLSRFEDENDITEKEFNKFAKLIPDWLEKIRYTFDYIYPDESRIECTLDSFQNEELKNLFLIEVEFTSEKLAKEFIPPYWFGEDVTINDKYYNASIIKSLIKNEEH
jgi:adenylate cyclase